MENKVLEKTMWTEADFETMEWHDCRVYAVSFIDEKYELAFDIDYILEWIDPKEGESYFKFWIVPATLVFKNVYDIKFEVDSTNFQIDRIDRENPVKPKNSKYVPNSIEYDWTIETMDGQMTFKSIGYSQIARKKFGTLLETQHIGLAGRGGISFDTL